MVLYLAERGMKHKHSIINSIALLAGVSALFIIALAGKDIAILNPAGTIAKEQYELLMFGTILSLIIIVPVFALTFGIAWRYRASNTKANYQPDWDGSTLAEAIWWIIPLILITILAVITWVSSHELDPYKPLVSDKQPVEVQVIALDWKWLFIYPEHDIASVNYLHIPVERPINFTITADAPMNSFWIPKLGGQVYAMAGMQTKLHLLATEDGVFPGSSANLSGQGFSSMRFETRATSEARFSEWVRETQSTGLTLDQDTYATLAQPSKQVAQTTYRLTDPGLFDSVIARYMHPSAAQLASFSSKNDEAATIEHYRGERHE